MIVQWADRESVGMRLNTLSLVQRFILYRYLLSSSLYVPLGKPMSEVINHHGILGDRFINFKFEKLRNSNSKRPTEIELKVFLAE
ncbi:hypothetical protein XELAEV_18046811mg [Xenopus laevis]|uniref:Uncharacterized protein n=1 Tax=Xenopus laevis TaxID=8355 RepID=A0A974BTP2_XENLA|nr:hypothetical protein XELAEV_18046811mg [Xenopus laevis]